MVWLVKCQSFVSWVSCQGFKPWPWPHLTTFFRFISKHKMQKVSNNNNNNDNFTTCLQPSTSHSHRYSESSHNCYSFVLTFLQALGPPGLEVKNLTKTTLCARLLLPHTAAAARYISLYRKLRVDGHLAVTRRTWVAEELPVACSWFFPHSCSYSIVVLFSCFVESWSLIQSST